jgi:tRNA(fMet)-specific endonuclease VapC
MKRYLLDTGPAQDFNNNRNGLRERVDGERHRGNRVGICVPVLGELWAGVVGSASRDRNIQKLRYGLSRLILCPMTNARPRSTAVSSMNLSKSAVPSNR